MSVPQRILIAVLALGLPVRLAAAPPADPPAAPSTQERTAGAPDATATDADAPDADTADAEAPDATDTVVSTASDDAPETLSPDVHEIARHHAIRIGLGFETPMSLGGLTIDDREAVFEDAYLGTDSAVRGSGIVSYRRDLLTVRLSFSGKVLNLVEGNSVRVEDGEEEHHLIYEGGGAWFGISAMAGITWEPTIYTAAGGSEGLTVALSALGGHEHVSIWGSFRDEFIPNYQLPEQSFHWIVERQRFDGAVALRWRHYVGGDTVRHLLGLEAGVDGSLYAHIPGISYASDAISGAKDVWGSWMIFVRLSWELGLPRD